MSEDRLEARVMELETRLSYQESTLETLNQELIRQQRLIEQMQLAIRVLAERIPQPAPEGALRGSLEDEIPPHY